MIDVQARERSRKEEIIKKRRVIPRDPSMGDPALPEFLRRHHRALISQLNSENVPVGMACGQLGQEEAVTRPDLQMQRGMASEFFVPAAPKRPGIARS
jgi:hypothetical protein